jgi:hypothetical protein
MTNQRKLALGGALLLASLTALRITSTLGQSSPGLTIAITNNNAISLVITNGTNTGKYSIYWTEFLDATPDWQLVTNGVTGVTNFTISIADKTSGFFEAVRNTNSLSFVLTVTIQAPANGSNVQ